MSINSSSLSAGLQVLSNDGLLSSNLTAQQLQSATPGQLTQLEMANVESTNVSALFNGGGSADDSVGLSANLTSSLLGGLTGSNSSATSDPVLQALETTLANSGITATSGTTNSSTAASATNPGSDAIGTLFNYLG